MEMVKYIFRLSFVDCRPISKEFDGVFSNTTYLRLKFSVCLSNEVLSEEKFVKFKNYLQLMP